MRKLLVALLICLAAPASASGPDDVLGVWKTEGDRSRIDLYKCGDKICARVSWLREPRFTESKDGPVGEIKFDRKNPVPALQMRPILGLQVIDGLSYVGENAWEKGTCYDPESGNSYKCNMKFISPDKLDVRGYIGFSLFGRTYTLSR